MKLEYDKEADIAYIYLKKTIKDGEVKKTKRLNEQIILDFDSNNKLLGFEILEASTLLNKEALQTPVPPSKARFK
ncbi:MAG: DUF2283 domain-containing protein [Nanoarchaeota archaeon]|nr:DUF2283 domain-containing protein [Nanoarchaeota archaeon]